MGAARTLLQHILAGLVLGALSAGCGRSPPAAVPESSLVQVEQPVQSQLAPAPASTHAAPPVPAVQSLDPALRPAIDLVGKGLFDQARALVGGYLEQAGEDALVYQADFVLAYSYQKHKSYEQARTYLERVIEAQPDYHAPYHFLGFCLYYLGDLDGARAAFERHLQGVPDEGDSHYGLGLVAYEADDLDEAERRFRRAIQLHTAVMVSSPAKRGRAREVAKSHARLGDVYQRRGEWEQARDEFERAVQLWPAHEAVWHKLHQAHLRLGDTERAAEALRLLEQVRAAGRARRNENP